MDDRLLNGLGTLARAIPGTRFHETMLEVLSPLVDWRARVVARYSPNALPEVLCDEGVDPATYDLYQRGYYRLDPYYGLCRSGPVSGVYTLRRDFPADRENAYMLAYRPLAGWRDELAVFFPTMGGASIGLFWEKSERVKRSEVRALEGLYPLLLGMHDAHVLGLIGIFSFADGSRDDRAANPYAIVDRGRSLVYQTPAWERRATTIASCFSRLLEAGGGIHRVADGEVLHVAALPESYALAPGGWVGFLEPSSESAPPIGLESALARFAPARLTPRESQILGLVLAGHPNARIAEQLGISIGAVKNHRVRFYRKLDISSERELFRRFVGHLTRVEAEAQ